MTGQERELFEALHEDRKQNADIIDKPSMNGVKDDVIDKYSDQAHFVYELLQNADDANATKAYFELRPDCLIFRHDGKRHFSVSDPMTESEDKQKGKLGDINAIVSIGQSSKNMHEGNSIGKFGVGFKAVFQYTSTPRVYDTNYCFKIERLVVPTLIADDYPDRQRDETVFVFTFDLDECPAQVAFNDISKKLQSLDYPLLFLSHLKSIEYEISGERGLYKKTVVETRRFGDTTAKLLKLTQKDASECEELQEDALWLFSRCDADRHVYAAGFFLNDDGYLIPKSHCAFCYFPTKTATNLNFIIHAPFRLTSSREGIRANDEHNRAMVNELANLSADSLVYLRDIGISQSKQLINDSIFEIVPYDGTMFTELENGNDISFLPFYSEIKKVFSSEKIIPTTDGYIGMQNAYRADKFEMAEVFSNAQLSELTDDKLAKWAFTSITRGMRTLQEKSLNDYIDSLIALNVDDCAIIKGRDNGYGASIEGLTASFIEAQPIEWLFQLYEWIAGAKNRIELARKMPIFLNQEGKAVPAFDEEDHAILFFPAVYDTECELINGALLQDDDIRDCISRIGITEPSLYDEIHNIVLPKYGRGEYECGDVAESRSSFKNIFTYYRSENDFNKRKQFLSEIKQYAFLMGTSEDGLSESFNKPNDLYFPNELIKSWFRAKPNTRYVCYDYYLEQVGEENEAQLKQFFCQLGIEDEKPRVLSNILGLQEAWQLQKNWKRTTREEFWTEPVIDGCAELLSYVISNKDYMFSLRLWKTLNYFYLGGDSEGREGRDSYYPRKVFLGRHDYFMYVWKSESFLSTTARALREQPWLRNVDGEFVSPSSLDTETLDSGYERNGASDFCEFLGIKIVVSPEESIDIVAVAEEMGLSKEDQIQAFRDYKQKKELESLDACAERESNTIVQRGNGGSACSSGGGYEVEWSPERGYSSNRASGVSANEIAYADASYSHEEEEDEENVFEDADVDDYSGPALNINRKIKEAQNVADERRRVLQQDEKLNQLAEKSSRYSFGWFKVLLELESLHAGDNNSSNRAVRISFGKVEREEGSSRTLILKFPSRHIPQSMEDLVDIPLDLSFADQSSKRLIIEAISVRSYTLRAKICKSIELDDEQLSAVTEALIETRSTAFLAKGLRDSFDELGKMNGYADNFDMKANLCGNIKFIFGPPGTGKTTHVAKDIIMPLMNSPQDSKVLVLAPTNKAADVLTSRLIECAGPDRGYLEWLVRFGTLADPAIEQNGVFRDRTFDIRALKNSAVVTTIARFPYDYFLLASQERKNLRDMDWDYIVVDEASMVHISSIAYLLYKAKPLEFIIAGDPFQIGPIAEIDTWKNENIYSMVELDSFKSPRTKPHDYEVELLTTQYRSIPEIGRVFSELTYDGVLGHDRKSDSQRHLFIESAQKLRPLNIIKYPVRLYESIYKPKRIQYKSPYQVYSALFVFEYVKYLISQIDIDSLEEKCRIGIVTPYRAQADLIERLVVVDKKPENVNVQVGTIHGFQGDECEIMIVLFNTPPKISSNENFFLNQLNIINVSISRARDNLIVVMPDDETEGIDELKYVKRLEALCKDEDDYGEWNSADIEEMMFGSRTYLEDNAFSTTHQTVNVYGEPEQKYEIRSETAAIDIQVH